MSLTGTNTGMHYNKVRRRACDGSAVHTENAIRRERLWNQRDPRIKKCKPVLPGPTKAIRNMTSMSHCYIASKTCHRIYSPETGRRQYLSLGSRRSRSDMCARYGDRKELTSMDCKDRLHLMTSSDSNASRIDELNRVSLQLGQACVKYAVSW